MQLVTIIDDTKADTMTEDISHDLFAVRLSKLDELKAQGKDPFAENWPQTHTSQQVLDLFAKEGKPHDESGETVVGPRVSVAGRIVVIRLMGKASFVKIFDRAGHVQLYFKKDVVGEEAYEAFKKFDLGDFVGAEGTLFVTKTGEVTVRVEKFRLISKSLRPMPEKWHGLTDSEQIYRQRYLDLIANQESRKRLMDRSRIVQEIRKFLWSRDFVEAETPCLHAVAGGAMARPFTTHMNALDHEFYLRISLELYLKRLLIGGVERVFEMSRVFRNEGLSRKHNPEFTMLELYQAYTDYRGIMELIYDLIQHLCKAVVGGTQVKQSDGQVIELGGKWREVAYRDIVVEYIKDPEWFKRSRDEKAERLKKEGLDVNPSWLDFELTQEFFSKRVEPTLIQPTFITHLPRELCPLAKFNRQDPTVLDVFELCINGQEIAPAYSEQNDPIVQRKLFEDQVGEEKHLLDEDFLFAMEHGMPPAGGLGIGIDRLCILLTGASNIRDTILFPSLKPSHEGHSHPPRTE
jgi:lysyl-tRNA synthetase class 2